MINTSQTGPLPGYACPGDKRGPVALYVPHYRHIWASPAYTKTEIEEDLPEEFIHSVQTCFRPSELLPLLCYLDPTGNHPGPDEFRDLVEGLYCAAYPLAHSVPVEARLPERLYSPFRDLGERFIGISILLSERGTIAEPAEARSLALWAVIATLLNTVPRRHLQGNAIADCLAGLDRSRAWSTGHDLFELLMEHLARTVNQIPDTERPFTVVRPHDAHELLVRCVEVTRIILDSSPEKTVAAVPTLLAALTLTLHRDIHLLWPQMPDHGNAPTWEVWRFVEDETRRTRKALATSGVLKEDGGLGNICPASLFQVNCLLFVEGVLAGTPSYSPAFLLHEMLELFPFMLRRLVLPSIGREHECRYCQSIFKEEAFLENLKRVAEMTTGDKCRVLDAASRYGEWLATDCARQASGFWQAFGVGRMDDWQRPVFALQGGHRSVPDTPQGYACAGTEGEKLAEFMPVLGQVWVYPGCQGVPELGAVLRHEVYHLNTSTAQPARHLPLRYALLRRPMPEPFRFHDIMEASFVLGATLEEGFPPESKHFPAAPAATRRLAGVIAERAQYLASFAAPDVPKEAAQREAAFSILHLLHHLIPARAGLGAEITNRIGHPEPPRGWRKRAELFPQLTLGFAHQLVEARDPCCEIMPPVEPHRSVCELAIFLRHCLVPVPERMERITQALPSLVSLFSFGAVVCMPIVVFEDRGDQIRARIQVVHGGEELGDAVAVTATRETAMHAHFLQQGVHCPCRELGLRLLACGGQYGQSADSERLVRYLEAFLGAVDVRPLASARHSCPECQRHLSDPTVQEAITIVSVFLNQGRASLLEAARGYERWLLEGLPTLAQHAGGFRKTVKAEKEFLFL